MRETRETDDTKEHDCVIRKLTLEDMQEILEKNRLLDKAERMRILVECEKAHSASGQIQNCGKFEVNLEAQKKVLLETEHSESSLQKMTRLDFPIKSYPASSSSHPHRVRTIEGELEKAKGHFLGILLDCRDSYERFHTLADSTSDIHREVFSRLEDILSKTGKHALRPSLLDSENMIQSLEWAIILREIIQTSTHKNPILKPLLSLEVVSPFASNKQLSGYRAASLARSLSSFRTTHTAGMECSRLSKELFCSDLGVSENQLIQSGLMLDDIEYLALANAFNHAKKITIYEGGLLSYVLHDDSIIETPNVLQRAFSEVMDSKNIISNWNDFFIRSTRPAVEFLSIIDFTSEIADAKEIALLHYFSEAEVYHKSTVEFRKTKDGCDGSQLLRIDDEKYAKKTSASWPGKGSWDLHNVSDLPPVSIILHSVEQGIISPRGRVVFLSPEFQKIVGKPFDKCMNTFEFIQGRRYEIFSLSKDNIVIINPDGFMNCALSDKKSQAWTPNADGIAMLEEVPISGESPHRVLGGPQICKEADIFEKFFHLMAKESREERRSSVVRDTPIVSVCEKDGIQIVKTQYLRSNIAGNTFLKRILETPNLDEKRFEAMCPYNIGSTNRELSHDKARRERWANIHDVLTGGDDNEANICYHFDQELDLGYLSPVFNKKSRISKAPYQSRSMILGSDLRKVVDFLSPIPDLEDVLLRPASSTQRGNIGYIAFLDSSGVQQRFAYLSVKDDNSSSGWRPLIFADVNNLSSGRTCILSRDLECYIDHIIQRIQNGHSLTIDNRGKKTQITFRWNINIRPYWNLEEEVVSRLEIVAHMMERYRTCAEEALDVLQYGDLENHSSMEILSEAAVYSKKYKEAMDNFMKLDNDLSSKIQRNALRSFMKYVGRITGGIGLQVGRSIERHIRSSTFWLEQSIHDWKCSEEPFLPSWDSATAQGYFSTIANLDRIKFSQLRKSGMLAPDATFSTPKGWRSIDNGIWVDVFGSTPAGQTFSDARLAFDNRSVMAELIQQGKFETIHQSFLSDLHTKAREFGAKASGEKHWHHKGAKDAFINTSFSFNSYLENQVNTILSSYNAVVPTPKVGLVAHLVKEYAYARQNFTLSKHKQGTQGAASIAYVRETKDTNKQMIQMLVPHHYSDEIDVVLHYAERIFESYEEPVDSNELGKIAERILDMTESSCTPERVKAIVSILCSN